jgi:hypothetical protein
MKWTRQIHKPVTWRCDVDHPAKQFDKEDDFKNHLTSEHSEYTAAQQEAISSSSKITRRRPRNVCPMCNYDISRPNFDTNKARPSRRREATDKPVQQSDDFQELAKLSKHIAGHLWRLALDSAKNLGAELDNSSQATIPTTNGKNRREGSNGRPPSGAEHLSNVMLDLPKSPGKFLWRMALAKVVGKQRTLNSGKDLSGTLVQLVRIRREFDHDWTVVDLHRLLKSESWGAVMSEDAASPHNERANWSDTVAFLKDRMNPKIKAEMEDEKEIREDRILQTMMTYSIWDRAYDNIRHEDPDLVEKYEKLLSKELVKGAKGSSDGTKNRIITQNPQERRADLETIIKGSLERMDENMEHQISAHNLIQQDQTAHAVATVHKLRDFVSEAFKASPKASLAWAGVCLILPILTNPTVVAQANRRGFIYVTAHMRYFATLESLLWPENQEEAITNPRLLMECEAHVVGLYQHILDFQLKSVLQFSRSEPGNFESGLIPHEDWTKMLSKIQYLESVLVTKLKGICVPASRQDLNAVGEHARGVFHGIQDLSAGEQQSQVQKGALQDLRLTDPRNDKSRIEDTKGGLLHDSYRWILENSSFRQWRDDQHSRLLWIKGDPGKGKTMLLCGIINELSKSRTMTGHLSYFFCEATDSRINSATAVLRGLLYLLVIQQPSLVSHIQKKYDHAGRSLFEDAHAWIALCEIFSNVLQDPSLNITYLIIDALDQCVAGLPKLLKFIVEQSSAAPRAKWIVSSRNWPDIEQHLERAKHGIYLSLEQNAESVSLAVSVFIRQKVDQLAQENQYGTVLRNAVLRHLTTNANDTFLWVALVCQDLKKTARRNVLKKLALFPAGLDALYERMMQQMLASDDAEICRCVLASTAILYRPVTVSELVALVEQLEDVSDDIREIISLCGSFLTLREDTVYFVHQSAKDFLFAKAYDEAFPDGSEAVHQAIFLRSLAILSKTLHRDMYSLEAPEYPIENVKLPKTDLLAVSQYPCVYWIDHLYESQALRSRVGSLEAADLVDEFLRKKYLYWLEGLSLCKSIGKGVVSMGKLWSLVQVCRIGHICL